MSFSIKKFKGCLNGTEEENLRIKNFLANIQSSVDYVQAAYGLPIKLECTGNKVTLTCGVTRKEKRRAERHAKRKEWIEKWLKQFGADDTADVYDTSYRAITIAIDKGHGLKVLGTATCSPNDTFDFDVGTAVAYARACGEKIPYYI